MTQNENDTDMVASTAAAPYIADCPIGCGASLLPTSLLLPEGPLRACAECGQLVSSVNEAGYWESMREFDTSVGTNPVEGAAGRRDKRAGKILASIRNVLGDRDGRISLLDVGCSSGVFMAAARARGVDAQGVEPAQKAAKTAQEAGFEVFCGTLEQAEFPAGSFDAVTILEVIEHLRDPVSLLQECLRVLKPGGVLAIGTGNTGSLTVRVLGTEWDYLQIARHGGHISFFNPQSMRLLAQRTGFEIERIRTRRVSFVADDSGGRLRYRLLKTAGEVMSAFVAMTEQGHDMLALLRPKN
jgi:2-polyprenyl-3-methyl-5-hydroxy-6-metoxy-1,4-benzoquinol methylase